MLLFTVHLAGLQILPPVLTRYLRSNERLFFDFSIYYPEKLIFQIYKYSAILIRCRDDIFF